MATAYYVYILRSEEAGGRFYSGLTHDVPARLKEHNSGKSKFTSGFVPWRLIHFESFETRVAARNREKYFKTGAGRRKMIKLLEQDNPLA